MNLSNCNSAFFTLRQVYPICCQQVWCNAAQPVVKTSEIVFVAPVMDPDIDLLGLHVSFLVISSIEENSACTPDPLTSHPWSSHETSLDCPWTSYCNFVCTENQ